MKNISIIGAGVMGSIFLKAVYSLNCWRKIVVTDYNREKLKLLKNKFSKVLITTDNILAVEKAEIIIVAVKPQSFLEVAKEIKSKVSKNCLIVSIMAGMSIRRIEKELGSTKIIRAMPNLGARVNKSMTVWTANKAVTRNEKNVVKDLFDQMGKSLYINNEKLIDKATAVSGSGPGFLFCIFEKWLEAIEKFGFSKSESNLMLLTTIDAVNELLQKEKDPKLLKKQVASKGGTTEAGLKVLDALNLKRMWTKVLQAAFKRAQNLSK